MFRFHIFRLALASLGLCVLATMLPSAVGAQTDAIDEVRVQRDQARAERARAAADLDPLLAANEELEQALALLAEDLATKRAALDATESRLERARLEVVAAQDQVLQEQANIESWRIQLRSQAITAYVQPRSDGSSQDLLSSSDLNEGQRRRALIEAVNTTQADILDQLRVAEANQELALARAEAVTREIQERQALAQQQVVEVNEAIARQQALQQTLDARIAEFQDEVDAHRFDEAALTSQLTGLIVEEEARQEALREAARIQAERERVAREEERIRQQRAADIAAGRTPQSETVSRAQAGLVDAPGVVGSILWPVPGPVTSEFGPRWGRQHNGIDIAANTGTTVLASASGQVVGAGRSGGFGNLVTIDHGNGLVTMYAHLNSINVRSGQQVSAGNSIGTVGCTGSCTGPHLHFETRVSGVPYNPRNYLS